MTIGAEGNADQRSTEVLFRSAQPFERPEWSFCTIRHEVFDALST